MSEVMTIMVWFHQQQYRTLKDFSTKHVMLHLRSEFPTLPSYNRFVELQSAAAIAVAITTVSLSRRSFKKMLDSGASCTIHLFLMRCSYSLLSCRAAKF